MFLSSLFFGISGPKFSKIFRKLKFLGAIESQAGGFLEDVTGSCRRTLRGFCEKMCTYCSFSWEAFRFRMPCKANYSTSGMTVWARSIRGRVARTSARQVLRERRGEMTYAEFSRRLGLPPSTLHRLENGDQSITLRGLQQIMKRLKCSLSDIFRD